MKLIDPQPMETLPEDRMDHVYVRYRTGEVLHAPRTVLWVREVGVKEFTAWSYTATPKDAAMKVEQMTNEELAARLLDGEYVVPIGLILLVTEAARRLRNSIPKPAVVVTFDDFDNAYYIVVNNQRCGRFIYDRIMANTLADDIRKALGLEGGGDE